MKKYLELVKHVLEKGETSQDRTGVGTMSCFGYQTKYDLRKGFPLLTTKKVIFESVIRELLWLLSGSTNVNDLHPCKIWDAWADENGSLGPVYGEQWRSWLGFNIADDGPVWVDQIANVIEQIKERPHSRRHIVSAWNVAQIDEMKLPPCHCFFQLHVMNNYLDCQLYQRSADVAVGVPFNIASYALLTTMIAIECNLTPRFFIHTFGNVHIYLNHIEGLKEQLKREPYVLPQLKITGSKIFNENAMTELKIENFKLLNYSYHPFIKFPVAV